MNTKCKRIKSEYQNSNKESIEYLLQLYLGLLFLKHLRFHTQQYCGITKTAEFQLTLFIPPSLNLLFYHSQAGGPARLKLTGENTGSYSAPSSPTHHLKSHG